MASILHADDQKNYLVLRLRDIDGDFFSRYQDYLADPEGGLNGGDKDFFRPGIPPELVREPTVVVDESGDPAKPHSGTFRVRSVLADVDVREEDGEDGDLKRPQEHQQQLESIAENA